MNIPKEIFDRLDALAAKMGQTASELWASLLLQQKIEGTILLVAAALVATVTTVVACALATGDEDNRIGAIWVVGVGGILTLIISYTGLSDLLNPTYGAFHDLLHLLGH